MHVADTSAQVSPLPDTLAELTASDNYVGDAAAADYPTDLPLNISIEDKTVPPSLDADEIAASMPAISVPPRDKTKLKNNKCDPNSKPFKHCSIEKKECEVNIEKDIDVDTTELVIEPSDNEAQAVTAFNSACTRSNELTKLYNNDKDGAKRFIDHPKRIDDIFNDELRRSGSGLEGNTPDGGLCVSYDNDLSSATSNHSVNCKQVSI